MACPICLNAHGHIKQHNHKTHIQNKQSHKLNTTTKSKQFQKLETSFYNTKPIAHSSHSILTPSNHNSISMQSINKYQYRRSRSSQPGITNISQKSNIHHK